MLKLNRCQVDSQTTISFDLQCILILKWLPLYTPLELNHLFPLLCKDFNRSIISTSTANPKPQATKQAKTKTLIAV